MSRRPFFPLRATALFACLVLAACSPGRPLTAPERQFTATLLGPSFDAAPVRLHASDLIGNATYTYPVRPRSACRERILPPVEGDTYETATAGVVVGERMISAPGWSSPDYVPNYPNDINLIGAMYLAHEMVHVWQWQNRAVTGYHPLKAAAEHARPGRDPYLFEKSPEQPFLDYPFEQQAAIVEEYVCCATLDPEGARTDRLRALLTPVFGAANLPPVPSVRGIYEGTDTRGICA